MKTIYLDVTDIIEYARHNKRVSGIQRVQVKIISCLVQRFGSDAVRCVFFHPREQRMVEFDPKPVFSHPEFDAQRLLVQLGLMRLNRVFPEKHQLKNYLRAHSHGKLSRIGKKIEILTLALLNRQAYYRRGFAAPDPALLQVPRIASVPVRLSPSQACLVFLGANWSFPEILEFGKGWKDAGGRVVQLVYDLIPHVHPEYFSHDLAEHFEAWLKILPQYATAFACISEWTAKDLRQYLRRFPGFAPAIEAVPLAHELDGFDRFTPVQPDSDAVAALAGKPYVLCVGTLEVRKNGGALLKVWQRLIAKGAAGLPRLVFAGKKGWLIDEFDVLLASDAGLRAQVTHIESPSDHDLAFLYQHSLFTAYPSIYEGWGLPVGESAWFGKHCIASQATSIPEVCGPLIDYVDPADLDSIQERIEHALAHPQHIRQREEGLRKATMRRWMDVSLHLHRFILDHESEQAAPVLKRSA